MEQFRLRTEIMTARTYMTWPVCEIGDGAHLDMETDGGDGSTRAEGDVPGGIDISATVKGRGEEREC